MTEGFYLFLSFIAGVGGIAILLVYLDRRDGRQTSGDHRHTPAE
jgi:hypothetical protein